MTSAPRSSRHVRSSMLPSRERSSAASTVLSMLTAILACLGVSLKRPSPVFTITGLFSGSTSSALSFAEACAGVMPPTSMPSTVTPSAILSLWAESNA